MRVLLAHPGTQHSGQLARELQRRHLLGEFWTGLAFPAGGVMAWAVRHRWAPASLAGLRNRIVAGVPQHRLRTQPTSEIAALLRMQRGGLATEILHARNAAFQQRIPTAALTRHDAIIGFDTSSWLLAQRCRDLGKRFYLDRTIAHPAALPPIIAQFNQRYPAWALSFEPRPSAVTTAEAQEHELATRIVVGGSFARDTLVAQGVAPERIVINSYGVDWDAFAPVTDSPGTVSRPQRFLFVGSVTARKGVPVLLSAWGQLGLRDAELWIVGRIGAAEGKLLSSLVGVRYFGQTSRTELPALYAQCDVLVLPSLFEGFGLVLLEALAAGLRVIATPHTGGADFLPNEALGRLVPAGEAEPLAVAMAELYTRPRTRAEVLAAVAPLRARFSWSAYGDRWAELLNAS